MEIIVCEDKVVNGDFNSYYNSVINDKIVDKFYNLNGSYGLLVNEFRMVVTKKGSNKKVSISLDRLTKINLESQLVLKFNLLNEWEIQRLSKSILSICGVGV